MDIRDIQNLIKFVSKSEVKEVDLEFENVKIKIVNDDAVGTTYVQQPVTVAQAPVAHVIPVDSVATTPVVAPAPSADTSNQVAIKSPMIGTFYSKSNPEKPAFVNVGDEIKAGQVVCVIEAMKLFNEIESEVSGKIVKILVDDASPVEYGQPLFLVEPN